MKQFASSGEPIRGDRTINEAEAAIVRRIFDSVRARGGNLLTTAGVGGGGHRIGWPKVELRAST